MYVFINFYILLLKTNHMHKQTKTERIYTFIKQIKCSPLYGVNNNQNLCFYKMFLFWKYLEFS